MTDDKLKELENKVAELQADNELLRNNIEYNKKQVEKIKLNVQVIILCILCFILGYCTNNLIREYNLLEEPSYSNSNFNKINDNNVIQHEIGVGETPEDAEQNKDTYTPENDFDNSFWGLFNK